MARDDAAEAEWIAPVTYLFKGAAPEVEEPQTAAAEAEPESPPRRHIIGGRFGSNGPQPRFAEPAAAESLFAERSTAERSTAELSPAGLSSAGPSSAEPLSSEPRRLGSPKIEARQTETRRIENVSTAALARRGMSESEVRSRLMEKGFTEEQVAPEIERLARAGYLDDVRLSEEIVRIESERKGKGRTAIVAELRRRGIQPDDYAEALGSFDLESERERAEEIALRKLPSLRALDSRTAERRLYALLARRGYSGELARSAVAEAMLRYAADEV